MNPKLSVCGLGFEEIYEESLLKSQISPRKGIEVLTYTIEPFWKNEKRSLEAYGSHLALLSPDEQGGKE